MKKNSVKSFLAVILAFMLMISLSVGSFAETIQDRVENYLNGIVDEYEDAETEEEQASIQERLSAWLAENGLDDVDLSSIADSDIGQIVSGLVGDSSIFSSLSGVGSLITDAFSSGISMIVDAVSGGLGTSDGSNTATTEPATSPNVIVADTTAESSTQAVGVPDVSVQPASSTSAESSTQEATTYNVGDSASPDIVGSGVSATEPAADSDTNSVVQDDSSVSTVAVLIVLSASTLAVIITMVIFFIMKRR